MISSPVNSSNEWDPGTRHCASGQFATISCVAPRNSLGSLRPVISSFRPGLPPAHNSRVSLARAHLVRRTAHCGQGGSELGATSTFNIVRRSGHPRQHRCKDDTHPPDGDVPCDDVLCPCWQLVHLLAERRTRAASASVATALSRRDEDHIL